MDDPAIAYEGVIPKVHLLDHTIMDLYIQVGFQPFDLKVPFYIAFFEEGRIPSAHSVAFDFEGRFMGSAAFDRKPLVKSHSEYVVIDNRGYRDVGQDAIALFTANCPGISPAGLARYLIPDITFNYHTIDSILEDIQEGKAVGTSGSYHHGIMRWPGDIYPLPAIRDDDQVMKVFEFIREGINLLDFLGPRISPDGKVTFSLRYSTSVLD